MKYKGSAGWLIAIKKRWKVLLVSFLIPALLAYIISLFVPKKYESIAEVLSPEITSGGSIIQTPLGAISRGGAAMTVSSRTILTILNSNYVIDKINKKYHIESKFHLKDNATAREFIKEKLISVINDDNRGVIQIIVRSRYNDFNYKVANYCVTLIFDANDYLKLTTNKKFIRVLNYAEPATIPYFPRKKLNALAAGILGIMLYLLYVYFKDQLSLEDE